LNEPPVLHESATTGNYLAIHVYAKIVSIWSQHIGHGVRRRPMIPHWLHALSIAYLLLGLISAVIIAIDLVRHPQHMWIMNVAWPVTALFGTIWVLWQYFTYGRLATHAKMHAAMERDEEPPNKRDTPFPVMVGNGTLHCGAGCTLGDIVAEWLVVAFPVIAVWFGWQGIFRDRIFAVWIVDYICAYAFGIVFQYFTIAPMRGLSLGKGLLAAIKADTLCLTAWQIGMYGFRGHLPVCSKSYAKDNLTILQQRGHTPSG
jgi:hypothetical protein